jgi:hypothetical protein
MKYKTASKMHHQAGIAPSKLVPKSPNISPKGMMVHRNPVRVITLGLQIVLID